MKKLLRKICREIFYHIKLSKNLRKINSCIYEIKGNKNKIFLRDNIKGGAISSDKGILEDIFINEPYSLNVLHSIIEGFDPKIIIDCGANIGIGSLYFNYKFPKAKIIAIEPENENYEMLLKNTKNIKNIECLNTGLWSKECYLEIVEGGNITSSGFIVQECEKKENSMKAESINSLIKKYSIEEIDILKIDIEGAEKELFSENIEWLSKVKILIIELHDRRKEGTAKSLFEAIYGYNYHFDISGENLIFYFKD